MVSAEVRITYHTQGTASELRSVVEGWSRVYTMNVEVERKETTLVAKPLETKKREDAL